MEIARTVCTFVYEIEQPSDLTYRISDWGPRPFQAAVCPHRRRSRRSCPGGGRSLGGTGYVPTGGVLTMHEFQLEVLEPAGSDERAPAGQSPDVLCSIDGPAVLAGAAWRAVLEPGRAIVVPAACAVYTIAPGPRSRVLVASLSGSS